MTSTTSRPPVCYDFLVEGDDHERELINATSASDALEAAAEIWAARYTDNEEPSNYTAEDFEIVTIYDENLGYTAPDEIDDDAPTLDPTTVP